MTWLLDICAVASSKFESAGTDVQGLFLVTDLVERPLNHLLFITTTNRVPRTVRTAPNPLNAASRHGFRQALNADIFV